jgi:putative FmdB family regulatory protein
MPHYVYRCANCSVIRSLTHSIMEDPEILCPRCEKQMNRIPQASAIQFKGDGFYSKDKNNG